MNSGLRLESVPFTDWGIGMCGAGSSRVSHGLLPPRVVKDQTVLPGCYRFGLVHTTPKSKYPLLLVTQREELPSCTAYEETELHYGDIWKAMEDLRLCHHEDILKVESVTRNGMAWSLGVREGMTATKADGWDRADSLDGGDEDGVTIVIRGHQRFWRLTMLQSNVMSAIRIATAFSEPENHLPVFWQKQISGNPDGESSLVAEIVCF